MPCLVEQWEISPLSSLLLRGWGSEGGRRGLLLPEASAIMGKEVPEKAAMPGVAAWWWLGMTQEAKALV